MYLLHYVFSMHPGSAPYFRSHNRSQRSDRSPSRCHLPHNKHHTRPDLLQMHFRQDKYRILRKTVPSPQKKVLTPSLLRVPSFLLMPPLSPRESQVPQKLSHLSSSPPAPIRLSRLPKEASLPPPLYLPAEPLSSPAPWILCIRSDRIPAEGPETRPVF